MRTSASASARPGPEARRQKRSLPHLHLHYFRHGTIPVSHLFRPLKLQAPSSGLVDASSAASSAPSVTLPFSLLLSWTSPNLGNLGSACAASTLPPPSCLGCHAFSFVPLFRLVVDVRTSSCSKFLIEKTPPTFQALYTLFTTPCATLSNSSSRLLPGTTSRCIISSLPTSMLLKNGIGTVSN